MIACLGSSQSFGQTGTLSLSSATGAPGASVSVNLNLTNGGGPSALGWTLTYTTSDLASVNLVAGASAIGAGKSLQCNSSAGQVICIVSGMNTTPIPDGVVAVATINIAPSTLSSTSTITVSAGLGALATGEPDSVAMTNGTISIVKPLPSSITPASVSLSEAQTAQFTANAPVTWSISPAAGSISAGLYTAPAPILAAQTVTVTATGVSNPNISVTATITLNPISVTASPALVSLNGGQSQQFTDTMVNTSNTAVTWSESPSVGTLTAAGLYTAPASISTAQNITITVASVVDPSKTSSGIVQLTASAVTVTTSPLTSSLGQSQTQQFSASVANSSNPAVTWSMNPSMGTISTSGMYTAPSTIVSTQNVTVTATSVSNPTKSGSSTVTLQAPVVLTVTPNPVTLAPSQAQQFAVSATNSPSGVPAVVWSVSPATGTISGSGLYTAPALVAASQIVVVRATSAANSALWATANITLTPNVAPPPPVISAVASTPATTSATITWTTDLASTSLVAYGTSASSLGLNTSNASIVTSHSIALTGLTAGTVYYYRVTSVSVAGASSTSPVLTASAATFTTTAASGCNPCSIWSSTAVPGTITDPDTNAVELGLKFTSDVAGTITGVRFYKGPKNTGTHTGHLWTTGGTLLATVTFSNETASGWQQANFATPVAIVANTTYIVSYYAPKSRYSADDGFFTDKGVDNAPLHALPNSTSSNGVYRYGTTSGFPNQTYQASNYWVDVVFVP